MKNEKLDIKEVERKINLLNLMIEKRRDRIVYYQKLIKMGLAVDDMRRLEFFTAVKSTEINELVKRLDWFYTQRSLLEL